MRLADRIAFSQITLSFAVGPHLANYFYDGSDALALISASTGRRELLQRSGAALLCDPDRVRLLDPTMKAGRRLALRLLGRRVLKAT